jgi:hypothetical protein
MPYSNMEARVGVWRLSRNAWADAGAVMRRNASVFTLAFIALLIVGWAQLQVAPAPRVGGAADLARASATMLAVLPISAVALLLHCAIIAPCALAVHRYVLLGGDADRAVWGRPRRIVDFAAALLVIDLMGFLPGAGLVLAALGVRAIGVVLFGVAGLVLGVALVAAVVCSVRLLLVFPGLALDRADAWRDSWRLTRGHWWAITGSFFVCLLGIWVVGIALALIARALPGAVGLTLNALFNAGAGVVSISVGAALASALYREYGGGMGGEAPWG